MDIAWSDFLFLFGWAILAALIAGAVCPLVGCLLHVRRTSFYGIALPQFAAAGVVAGFVVLPWWVESVGIGFRGLDIDTVLGDPHAAMNWHLIWAGLFTFGGLIALTRLRGSAGSEIGQVAAAFAIASAATILFGHFSATGGSFVYGLLRGELLAIGVHELETVAVLFGFILVAVVALRRELVLVSYDRESAIVLGVPIFRVELTLALVTGLAVSVGTMTFGPVLLFGFLVLPPLAARQWARSMSGYLALASFFGVLAGVGGVVLSKYLDLPLGPAVVAVAALETVPGALHGARSRVRKV
jgi:ABC-type Mn2+/Zn2+ transport system permease subunit